MYVEKSLNESNIVLILNGDQPNYGFAFINIKSITSGRIFDIDILCSSMKGGGTILINTIKRLMPTYNIREISLDSLESALGFYVKLGFKCSSGACPMHYKIKWGGKFKKIRSKSKKNKKIKTYRGRSRRHKSKS